MRVVLEKLHSAWRWLLSHPVAMLNVIGLLVAGGLFLYLMNKPIDVLENWTIATTEQAKDGKLPVYHPGQTLEFTSKSVKLISAEGLTTRIFECDATKKAVAREIQLDQLVANRAPGVNPPRENSIVVPDVTQFNGLPRTCRLVISVCYDNVVLWRDHCETAVSNDFRVAVNPLDPAAVQKKIDDLQKQIEELQKQLIVIAAQGGSSEVSQNTTDDNQNDQVATTQGTESSRSSNSSNTNNTNGGNNGGGSNTPPAQDNRNLLERAVDGVTDTVDGIVELLR